MPRIRIDVTAEDIAEARDDFIRGCAPSLSCPIARAASRKLKGVQVSIERLYADKKINGQVKRTEYALPTMAVIFISDFDHGESVEPFSFRLGKIVRQD